VIQTFITALENRVKAMEVEAEDLLTAGEAEYAKLKTAIAAELTLLKKELQQLAGNL
jgi:phage host-nuclease inhibitor protein Gam